MVNKQGIILLSGGLDSTVLLAQLRSQGYHVHALSFNYGQRHLVELDFAKINATKYGVLSHKVVALDNQLFNRKSSLTNKDIKVSAYTREDLPEGVTDAYVPFRNTLFLANAVGYAEAIACPEVFVAFNKDDSKNFPDCTESFVTGFNNLIDAQYSDTQYRVIAPFLNKSKAEIVQLSKRLDVDISQTLTCYSPNGKEECGVCLSCVTKRKALAQVS